MARSQPDAATAHDRSPSRDTLHRLAIQRTAAMADDRKVAALAAEHGLQVLDVTWEDTGRFFASAVGPNISDMTIQVQYPSEDAPDRFELACMPVIRVPNFSDVTGDVPPDQFFLLVGNERGEPLRKITLQEFLANLRDHLTKPESWAGKRTSLLAPKRDSHVLVSAQACFLPVPQEGLAEFNPVLFNYQARPGEPAVLAILATREGTSATVIDNERDGFDAGRTWGQRLFFNANGERASLTAQRRSDFVMATETASDDSGSAADREGLNMVLLIQVPLKQRPIERDYSGIVNRDDMVRIAAQIERVYQQADYVGSLVLESATGRSTEHDGPKFEPPGWWDRFWERHFANTGQTREEAIELLESLLGAEWKERGAEAAEEALMKRQSAADQ